MSLDLDFDDAQASIRDAVAQFCSERAGDDVIKARADDLPRDLWHELAELGVLSLCTPEGEGGAVELVAALESLGRAAFPGPLSATFLATQLLDGEARASVGAGESIVSVGEGKIFPFAPVADLFLVIDAGRAFQGVPAGPVERIETLGAEPWGRLRLERERDLGDAERAITLHDLALAAYASAAGRRLVDDAAEHARTRTQFGRAIGEFQAVAHPLADCAIRLSAAESLARAAADRFERNDPAASALAAAARLSSTRAALEAAFTTHQTFGAIGITLEGPVFHLSRRIQQLAAQPPGETPAREVLLADLERAA